MTRTGTAPEYGSSISIHIPRVGDDSLLLYFVRAQDIFQSTSPVWGMTSMSMLRRFASLFQSTSPVWGMTLPLSLCFRRQRFQSTSPVWGMTENVPACKGAMLGFQSTSPVWGMTNITNYIHIKIHISIHIPRVGDDFPFPSIARNRSRFQSTSPVWGMTLVDRLPPLHDNDFNPHPPCGG